ncbi:MAG: Vi polysaccharide biosynthesis UDP-N-acetylglucosamine C-6 dehydrogenase TviB [Proteobacteria bacterium]|nr:Vi polysaccharide biosynthesis UDP-N-acetylglucosamine C-6 dehydrogenase TviB [Pseudomonadota bacterium]
MLKLEDTKIAVIGMGYVGLPLAVEFAKNLPVLGFDINTARIEELKSGKDSTLEINEEELSEAKYLTCSSDVNDLKSSNVYIVTVPTPIDKHKKPDLTPLEKASEMLAGVISKGDVVIYESTVFPGATEDICIPLIEQGSGLVFNKDFYAGYSPERINPGDKEHRVSNILKITSGSTPEVADYVDDLYKSIITAGTHKASSLKVAEAAKVIENVQRDVNIALINELALIFSRLDIDTLDVLEAAGTKWNFLPFRPGLVGGHCIGVDPYYLVHKAQETGFEPSIIPASRYTNEFMATHVIQEVIKLMSQKRISIVDANILVLGLAFKEDCPDLRNTKVVDLLSELAPYNANVDVYDPWVSHEEAKHEYDLSLIDEPEKGHYDAIIIAVSHQQFKEMGAEGLHALGKKNHVLYDIKYILPSDDVDGRL